MLNIFYGNMPGAVFNTAVYFKNVYEDAWITAPIAKEMILIANESDKVFNASTCGDNCAKWILKLAEKQDITINLRHLMDFGEGGFTIHIMNNGQVVHTMKELIPVAGLYV